MHFLMPMSEHAARHENESEPVTTRRCSLTNVWVIVCYGADSLHSHTGGQLPTVTEIVIIEIREMINLSPFATTESSSTRNACRTVMLMPR